MGTRVCRCRSLLPGRRSISPSRLLALSHCSTIVLNKSEAGSGKLAAESGCWDARCPITPTMLDDRTSAALIEVADVEAAATRHGHRRTAHASCAAVAGSESESGCWGLHTIRTRVMPLLPTALPLACQPPAPGADRSAAPKNCCLLQRACTRRACERRRMIHICICICIHICMHASLPARGVEPARECQGVRPP